MYLKINPDRVARLPYLDGLHHPSVAQLPQHQVIIKLTRTLQKRFGGRGSTRKCDQYRSEMIIIPHNIFECNSESYSNNANIFGVQKTGDS